MAEGLLKSLCEGAIAKIEFDVVIRHSSIFGRNIPSPRNAPWDLRDSEGDYCVSSDGTPLIQLLKVSGDDCEIAYGSASLVDTAIMFAHPLLTFFGQGMMAFQMIGLRGFILLQLIYAIGALALLGRSWKYIMRPTVAYALGLTSIQVMASMFLGDFATPIVAIASALIIGRPFVEQFLNNQDGSNRPFKLSNPYQRPSDNDDWTKREAQIKNASSPDAGPVMVLGTALGRFKQKGDAMAPDEGMPMGISHFDLCQHMMLFGKPGTGKTGALLPLAQQWLTLGRVENGKFKNGGGAFLICGKGVLPRDIIEELRASKLDRYLKLSLISPMPGESKIAPLQGMTPNMVATALYDLNVGAGQSSIWSSAGTDRIRKAGTLLEAADELEGIEMAKKAKARGFSSHAAWMGALDKVAREKKRQDGTLWGFKSAKHYQNWRLKNGLAADPQILEATRRFQYVYSRYFDMTADWINDAEFLTGQPPAANQTSLTAQNAPLLSKGSSGEKLKVQPSAAPQIPGGFVAWMQNHPALIEGDSGYASVLKGALDYAVGLLSMRAELVQDVRWTAAMWMAPVMEDPALRGWADLEPGDEGVVDVTDCLRGACIGLEIPRERYGEAGAIMTALAKKRVFDAIKMRPTKWRDDPTATSVLLMMDEVHLLINGNKDSDESTMASIGRSMGLCMVMATQSREVLDGVMGEASMTGLLNNFASIIVFSSAPATMSWANDFLRTQTVTSYSQDLGPYYRAAMPADYLNADAGPARDRLHRALRYKLTRPVGVKLTDKDRAALQNEDDKSGSVGVSIGLLAWMFSVGLITNVVEAARGTFSMIGRLFKHGFTAFGQATTGGLRAPDGYVPPASGMTAKREEIELFPEEEWAKAMEMQFTAVMSINRGKHPRRDIVKTIGPMSLEVLEGIANKQPGVMTIYRAKNEGLLLKQAA